jgi:hypothetical protein
LEIITFLSLNVSESEVTLSDAKMDFFEDDPELPEVTFVVCLGIGRNFLIEYFGNE